MGAAILSSTPDIIRSVAGPYGFNVSMRIGTGDYFIAPNAEDWRNFEVKYFLTSVQETGMLTFIRNHITDCN